MSGDLCIQCGQPGHFIKDCPNVVCSRCLRSGHATARCYAKTDINGKVLNDDFVELGKLSLDGVTLEKCLRCGRAGHDTAGCYAKTNAAGRYIPKVRTTGTVKTVQKKNDKMEFMAMIEESAKPAEIENSDKTPTEPKFDEPMVMLQNNPKTVFITLGKPIVKENVTDCQRCMGVGHHIQDCKSDIDLLDNWLVPLGKEQPCATCGVMLYVANQPCECISNTNRGVVGKLWKYVSTLITAPPAVCTRCGRKGHDISKCDAKVHMNRRQLLPVGSSRYCDVCEKTVYYVCQCHHD
jgi:hypothetical protein